MKHWLVVCTAWIWLALGIPAAAESGPGSLMDLGGNQLILRAPEGEIKDIAQRHGLEVLRSVSSRHGDVVLVEGPSFVSPEEIVRRVGDEAVVLNVEPVQLAGLPEDGGIDLSQSFRAILGSVRTEGEVSPHADPVVTDLTDFFGTSVWNGYANQPAVERIRLREAQVDKGRWGEGVIAVIDTGVDQHHPLLKDALVPGYDFLQDEAGDASEWKSLDSHVASELQQSFRAILGQSFRAILGGEGEILMVNHSTAAVVDQSFRAILGDAELPPAFGHGTMVAGVIRLAAPGAKIMPLRVFDGHGNAHLFDIVRAIYWAVDHGANVINMSFSVESFSPELMRAINYAHRNGVICVASAGNAGRETLVYPAALGNVVGVGSTTLEDGASEFTNLGSDLVLIGAPGEAVITAYPGGLFAAASGTSFAAPFVAGAAGLIQKGDDSKVDGKKSSQRITKVADYYQLALALAAGAHETPEMKGTLGSGRLDVFETVVNAK